PPRTSIPYPAISARINSAYHESLHSWITHNMDRSQSPVSSAPAHISDLFDQWASTDRAQKMATGHQPLIEALLADLAPTINPQACLLDLGCGTGAFLAQAAKAGFRRTCGIDAAAKMIATAQDNAPDAELQIGSFTDLPWPSSSFSHVITIEALYYCAQPLTALQEVARVLSSGGRFDLIIDYYQDSSGTASWPEGLGFEITCLSAEQWTALATDAGLEALQTRRILRPQAEPDPNHWEPTVWFPTLESYRTYLKDGALWITGYGPAAQPR
ncbi:MAG: methyltransferase domain-containing protein, partial [Thermosynechococcaceae cyanobacterium]